MATGAETQCCHLLQLRLGVRRREHLDDEFGCPSQVFIIDGIPSTTGNKRHVGGTEVVFRERSKRDVRFHVPQMLRFRPKHPDQTRLELYLPWRWKSERD